MSHNNSSHVANSRKHCKALGKRKICARAQALAPRVVQREGQGDGRPEGRTRKNVLHLGMYNYCFDRIKLEYEMTTY